jgi:hypothetical protein
VEITENAAKIIRGMLQQTTGPWFIKEARSSQSKKYCAGLYHDAVVAWLRNDEERGIKPFEKITKPLHELRKEAGANASSGPSSHKGMIRAPAFPR